MEGDFVPLLRLMLLVVKLSRVGQGILYEDICQEALCGLCPYSYLKLSEGFAVAVLMA